MPNNLVFSQILNGGITFTGNTIGLSKTENSQNAGTANSIGAFITTNTSLQVSTYPSGTTLRYILNSSEATLELPQGSTVLFAILSWGGCCKVPGENRINPIVNGVILKPPPPYPNSEFIFPRNTYFTDETQDVVFYSCYAIVTQYVKNGSSGVYRVNELPATTEATDNSNNCGGWTLAVVYTNSSLPARNISIYSGLEQVTSSTPFSITPSFRETPQLSSPKGRLLLSAMHASATLGDNRVLFGHNSSNLISLSGPRNLPNHFFGSQINNDSGNLNTSGSFGDRNQNILTGMNITAGRQGWDITNVDISAGLINSQTSAILNFITSNNPYLLNLFAIQTDTKFPSLDDINKTVSPTFASVGDTVEYSISITNNNSITFQNVILTDSLSSELSYEANSLTINGNLSTDSPITGVNLGSISPSQTVIVNFKATVNAESSNQFNYINSANISYQIEVSPNFISGTSKSNICKLYTSSIIVEPDINITAIPSTVSVGDTVQYTISITNTTNNIIENCIFKDILPSELSYITNSLNINGIPSTSSPTASLSLGSINPWQTITIIFKAIVNSKPNDGSSQYTNSANLQYSFNTVDGLLSNTITSTNTIYSSDIDITPVVTKSAVSSNPIPDVAFIGDTIDYTITIFNPSSNKHIKNSTFKDSLPSSLSLQPNSLTVNGNPISGDIGSGINLGTIAPNDTTTIKFTVKVIGINYVNSAIVDYEFLSPNNTPVTNSVIATKTIYSNTGSNPSPTDVNPITFNYKKTTYKNFPIIGKVLALTLNDSILEYTLCTPSKNGYVKVNIDGTWTYTPEVNFVGVDSFSVLVTDVIGSSNTSTITITVKEFPKSLDDLNCCEEN
ncbi:DUF11 domain-containing protein [Clostridium botulinum]|uniref:DUF11 domain-containing protein n=1 Tax=Clostridium botulinum C/D str. DC5 TaxID=1443128 RepID=A0A0A0IGF6_CLOBO|nr:cadherin-like domain-containing protein [Clostridium botulinum]KGM98640.1 hypothetical protein Z955_10770 [Clostridium botulinum C/D str. DC5]KOC50055.1 hypothetical protein ADU89_14990 [Clostridium botulinum]KOC52210.1 hypothetical protein ADU90_14695 [Clostridium botulinum]MCD3235125.1 DUF11 domain-containing protein [Clostridium botulinum D/C]MCD3241064.1 DUF11 domain-containing protein [Clostridium botulinum D/C]